MFLTEVYAQDDWRVIKVNISTFFHKLSCEGYGKKSVALIPFERLITGGQTEEEALLLAPDVRANPWHASTFYHCCAKFGFFN